MRAAMFHDIGDVRIADIPEPHARPGEVVIKVESALTCGTDVKTYKRGHPLRRGPGVFGHECSGTVVEVGEGVTKFKMGDRVATHNSAPCNQCYFCKVGQSSMCGTRVGLGGAYAQYVRIPKGIVEQNAFLMPEDMSFTQATLLEPFSCAVYCVDETPIRLADTVIVNGAGPLGLMIIRLAAMRGASVIATDLSDYRLDMAKKMGADVTINAASVEDQVKAARAVTPDGRGADVVIEAVGTPETWEKSILMSRKGGFIMEFGGCKRGTTITIDTELMHYSQLTIKGLFHTTPRHVQMAFDLLKRRVITAEDFVTGKFTLDECVKAILDHASGNGIKNEIAMW